jgi:hypothetical protein
MPLHVVRESFGPLFLRGRSGRRRRGERDVMPKLDGARLPPLSRSGPGRPYAAVVLALEVEGRRLVPHRSLDHAGSQGRRERCGDRLDRRALATASRVEPTLAPDSTRDSFAHGAAQNEQAANMGLSWLSPCNYRKAH